jgi:hypothetical protein
MPESTAPTAATFAAGLRSLAALIDKHPGLAKDLHGSGPRAFLQYNYNIDQRAQLTRWVQAARKLGATVSEAESRMDGDFGVHLDFGSLRVSLWASREKVCDQVVVGTETVDKVEWRCPALDDTADAESTVAVSR